MIDWQHLSYALTPEDRRIRAKWARGVSIVYGAALLVLLTAAAAQRMVAEPAIDTAVATATAKAALPVNRN